jgi:hypothetical protein
MRLPKLPQQEMTYLDSITLTRTLPCLADPGRIIIIGKPSRPLDALASENQGGHDA